MGAKQLKPIQPAQSYPCASRKDVSALSRSHVMGGDADGGKGGVSAAQAPQPPQWLKVHFTTHGLVLPAHQCLHSLAWVTVGAAVGVAVGATVAGGGEGVGCGGG